MSGEYPIGNVTIAENDKKLVIVGVMDVKLLKKAIKPFLKSAQYVEFATYPHNDGGNAILMRDSCSRNRSEWSAISPVVEDDV